MKRRDFFAKLALITTAVSVAPRILAQEPVKALDPYHKALSNPYYQWVRTKRNVNHVKDNNYWQCLNETRSGAKWTQIATQRDICSVCFKEYDWVYQKDIVLAPTKWDRSNIVWMNIEDYVFYQDLYNKQVFDPVCNNLLGAGLVPRMRDAITLEFTGVQDGIIPYCVEGNNGYEIHIMYQKIK